MSSLRDNLHRQAITRYDKGTKNAPKYTSRIETARAVVKDFAVEGIYLAYVASVNELTETYYVEIGGRKVR